MADEHNLFRKAIGYITARAIHGPVDGIQVGDPNGGLDAVDFHVLVRKADQVETGDFRRYMTEQLAQKAAGSPHVLKFRLHLFEPLDTGRPEAAGVVHDEASEKQYHAASRSASASPLRGSSSSARRLLRRWPGEFRNSSRSSPFPRTQCLYVCVQWSHDGRGPAGISGRRR